MNLRTLLLSLLIVALALPLIVAPRATSRAQATPPAGVIAFIGVDEADNASLYLLNLASGAVGQIDTPVSPDADLAWQPEGETLAFTTADGGYGLLRSLRGCFEADQLCGDIVEVFPPFVVKELEWSADGTLLYFLSDTGVHVSAPRARPADTTTLDTQCDLGIAIAGDAPYLFCAATDLAGNEEAHVYIREEAQFSPLYTVGTFTAMTAFDIARNGASAVGTMEAEVDSGFFTPPAGVPVRLAQYQIHIYDLEFAPAGDTVAIAGASADSTGDGTLRDGDPAELFLYDAATANLLPIPEFTGANALTWSPDDQHILVITNQRQFSIFTRGTNLVTAVNAQLPGEIVSVRHPDWTTSTTLPQIIPTATTTPTATANLPVTSTPIPTPTPRPTAFPTVTPFPTLTPYFPTITPYPSATPGSPMGTGCEYAFVGGGGLPVAIGDTAQVTPYGAAVRLRAAPALTATQLAELPPGTQMEILNGYVCAQGYRWWEVRLANGLQGYLADSDPGGYWIEAVLAPPAETINFYADRYTINQGECVTITWNVEGIKEVYYEGAGVTGHESRQECPAVTTTYELRVIRLDDTEVIRQVSIFVITP